ncbi:MAG: tetratricopeptide repeat protein [Bacteroidota bacterium]
MMRVLLISPILFLFACGSPDKELKADYENLTDETTGLLNPDRSRAFLAKVDEFAKAYSNNEELASEWLFKSGEVAQGIQDHEKSLEIYQQILKDFPNGDRAADATFMIAFTYDENFNNKEKAREYYELFLTNYPEDDFADDASILLEMLNN